MKRIIITSCAIILLSLYISSCNNQSESAAPATEQTTPEVKSVDSAAGKKDTVAALPVMEEKVDTIATKRKTEAPVKKNEVTKATTIDQSAIDEGKALIAKSDCLACHKLQGKLIGPSYEDVSNKYSYSDATVQSLAGKIVSGGTGVWGQVPMTPHPGVAPEGAKKMVTYILSLKK